MNIETTQYYQTLRCQRAVVFAGPCCPCNFSKQRATETFPRKINFKISLLMCSCVIVYHVWSYLSYSMVIHINYWLHGCHTYLFLCLTGNCQLLEDNSNQQQFTESILHTVLMRWQLWWILWPTLWLTTFWLTVLFLFL